LYQRLRGRHLSGLRLICSADFNACTGFAEPLDEPQTLQIASNSGKPERREAVNRLVR
jgi:hypothetical protein